MMKIMIPLPQRHQRRNHIIPRTIPIVKRLLAHIMRERIYRERRLLHEEEAQDSGIYGAAHPVVPEDSSHCRREDDAKCKGPEYIVSVLECDEFISVKIRSIRPSNPLRILLQQHPPHVCVCETLLHRIRILGRICVSMMRSVSSSPPTD